MPDIRNSLLCSHCVSFIRLVGVTVGYFENFYILCSVLSRGWGFTAEMSVALDLDLDYNELC